jgi:hypothetical protein
MQDYKVGVFVQVVELATCTTEDCAVPFITYRSGAKY